MKKIYKWLIAILITLLVICAGSFFVIKGKEYQPSTSAMTASKVSTTTNNITKFSGNNANPNVIFYPGALVEPKSYSIWAKKVAQAGFNVYIVRFPLDLAVLKTNIADKVDKTPGYVIGGHSLGGTMASRYAHNHQKNLKGVFFLASYPETKGDLRKTNVPVLSITASKDGVLKWKNYKNAKKLLPSNTVYEQISGGNHAGFGSYGKQKGDNSATISNRQQQNIVSRLLINWLNREIKK
ncbi:alpha/beta hydrolase [Companilactobacillus suantsaicola]|uniref:Alpha/beta hydrolase n=1 Tax=Companilactobacillus suantsaicola TaxID=2487723 RepID=A0A4Z0JP67_9LACO|nr:alpha/beta hydrolase [Companilactobacillus suantsaicola]TGD24884.1 alpha/beta hydrolase [Companilactobacillus suantsaicola]